MNQNKKNMLVFGGFALMLFTCMEHLSFETDISAIALIKATAILSLWISIVYFVVVIVKEIMNFFSHWFKFVKKDEA